jgi:hypothetical protein
MISVSTARRLALALPGVEERSHHDHPDFRVGGKIFATLWPARRHSVLKLKPADQQALVQMEPTVFSLCGWVAQGWVCVDLRRVSAAQYRTLVADAWRNVAPGRGPAETTGKPRRRG